MESKIVRRYIVNVYSDHTISTEELELPIENEIEVLSLDGILKASGSLRVKQVLYLVKHVEDNENDQRIEDKISTAVKQTAIAFNVTSSSVVDKVTRQMDWSMKEFSETLESYLKNGNAALRERLLKKIGKFTQDDDKVLIDTVLK